jgi:hypothetical protein
VHQDDGGRVGPDLLACVSDDGGDQAPDQRLGSVGGAADHQRFGVSEPFDETGRDVSDLTGFEALLAAAHCGPGDQLACLHGDDGVGSARRQHLADVVRASGCGPARLAGTYVDPEYVCHRSPPFVVARRQPI